MVETHGGSHLHTWMDDGTGWSEAEIALLKGAALLGSGLILLLRAADTVFEAWPLPTSRVRR